VVGEQRPQQRRHRQLGDLVGLLGAQPGIGVMAAERAGSDWSRLIA
jgi:hypothetical protein